MSRCWVPSAECGVLGSEFGVRIKWYGLGVDMQEVQGLRGKLLVLGTECRVTKDAG